MQSVTIQINSLTPVPNTNPPKCTGTFQEETWPGGGSVDQQGNIQVGNANSITNITFRFADTLTDWTFQSEQGVAAFSATPQSFTQVSNSATQVVVQDNPNAWEYTLSLFNNGTNYFLDPRVVNR